jgi:Outer membrane lipoprotein/SPOR domain
VRSIKRHACSRERTSLAPPAGAPSRAGIASRLGVALLALSSALLAHGQAPTLRPGLPVAQTPSRLVDVIDIDEHDNQVNITLQFNCSLHYAGHSPTSEGTELRLRLRPDRDCGAAASTSAGGSLSASDEVPTEIPPISGPRGILSTARLESSLGGEVTLTLSFSKPEAFVLAQGASPLGMRVRLIRARGDKPRILVTDRGDSASNFAVNLESQHEPFDPAAVEMAGERLQTKAFVSVIDAGGEKWYRLRAGPFDQRDVAESVLRAASKDYPRAWLAVGDDSITTDPNSAVPEPPLPPVEPIGADKAMDPVERKQLFETAGRALRAHQYPEAIEMLTKLQRQPEFPQRAAAQELLGLARERAGEIAHAKAEYEEYLRRYPKGPAADRVRTRLRILRAATAPERSGGGDSATEAGHGWNVSGGATQLYRRDTFETSLGGTLPTKQPSRVVENAIFTDTDVFARHTGERLDFSFRLNAGLEENFLRSKALAVGEPNLDNRVRVTTAFFDLDDKLSGLRARIGRQTATTDGIFGTFDGAMLQYQVHPGWALRGTVGSPILNAQDNLDTRRRFATLALDYGPELAHWNSSFYLTQETLEGVRDRQAVGTEWQYFVPGRSVVSYVDYDTQYHSLNAAVLLGTVQLPDRWLLTVDLERRNAPLLTTENALIGQVGIGTLPQLQQTYSQQQIFQLAKDRTPMLSTYSVSAMKQLGERFQVMLDVFVTQESATPASGGVEAIPGTLGSDISYQVQLFGTGLLSNADFHQLVLRYDHLPTADSTGVDYIARYPIWGSWRIGPRFLVQRIVNDSGPVQYVYNPYAHADWQRHGRMIEIEAGTEIGRNPDVLQIGNTTRLFVSMGYRVNF